MVLQSAYKFSMKEKKQKCHTNRAKTTEQNAKKQHLDDENKNNRIPDIKIRKNSQSFLWPNRHGRISPFQEVFQYQNH